MLILILLIRIWDNSSSRNVCDSYDENGVLFETASFSDEVNHTLLYVAYLNRAPVLSNSAPVVMEIFEDINPFNNIGISIRDILNNTVNDADDLEIGIAVIAFFSSIGLWEVTLERNRSDWTSLPANISRQNPLLLTPDYIIRLVIYLLVW